MSAGNVIGGMISPVAKLAREQRFEGFVAQCEDIDNAEIIARIYVLTKGKDNMINLAYKTIRNTASTGKYGSYLKWVYRPDYFVSIETGLGMEYIHIRGKTENPIAIFLNIKTYNKAGEHVYYGRVACDKTFRLQTAQELITRALHMDIQMIRKIIFDELETCLKSELITYMKTCYRAVEIIPANYYGFDKIPRDFTITHTDSDGSGNTYPIHKFVASCFSEFMRVAIAGTGDIKGVDTVDLSVFERETVVWFTKLIYNPTVIFSDLDDDQWALLNYMNVDIDGLVARECVKLYLFE